MLKGEFSPNHEGIAYQQWFASFDLNALTINGYGALENELTKWGLRLNYSYAETAPDQQKITLTVAGDVGCQSTSESFFDLTARTIMDCLSATGELDLLNGSAAKLIDQQFVQFGPVDETARLHDLAAEFAHKKQLLATF